MMLAKKLLIALPMQTTQLTTEARHVINQYLHLPIKDHKVSCPYRNNRKTKVRGALRVLIGKGSIDDIVKEVDILALRKKTDLSAMSDTDLKQFLVDEHIGIDCSGFVFHVLDAELSARTGKGIKQHLCFPYAKGLRKVLTKLRPAENTNVKTLAHEQNSQEVTIAHVAPGDLITIIRSGTHKNLDHVLLVESVDMDDDKPETIHYVHSFQWSTDGQTNHGVRRGSIAIADMTKKLDEQTWTEQDKSNPENETWERANDAQDLSLRRLNALMKKT